MAAKGGKPPASRPRKRSNVIDISTRKSVTHQGVDANGRRDWPAIRARYVQGAESIADIAKELDIPLDTIHNQARNKRGNGNKTWSDLREAYRAEREAAIRAASIEASTGGVVEALRMQSDIALLVSKATKEFLDDLIAGAIEPGEKQGMADVFDKIMAGTARATMNVRMIAGLTAGQASAGSDDDDLLGGVEIFGLDDEDEVAIEDIG